MAKTQDLGRRVELVSMDANFHSISIALYRTDFATETVYNVHSYSGLDGVGDRLATITAAMETMGNMTPTCNGLLQFPCGDAHELAARRLFLECCKLVSDQVGEARPLQIYDKKSETTIVVRSLGNGIYEVRSDQDINAANRRQTVIARGLLRLGDMQEVPEQPYQIQFGCSESHDALIGLLLVRAPNVRAAIREAEELASRGVLSAPSAQD